MNSRTNMDVQVNERKKGQTTNKGRMQGWTSQNTAQMTVIGMTECCEWMVGKAGSGRTYVCAIPVGAVATTTAAAVLEAAAGKGWAWNGDQQMKRPTVMSMRAGQYNRAETNKQGQTGTSKQIEKTAWTSGGDHKRRPVSMNGGCPNEQQDKHKWAWMKELSGSSGRGQREWRWWQQSNENNSSMSS